MVALLFSFILVFFHNTDRSQVLVGHPKGDGGLFLYLFHLFLFHCSLF
jgi:hypothetical protein